MGYRSQWMLAVGGSAEARDKFKTWLKKQSETEGDVYKTIHSCKRIFRKSGWDRKHIDVWQSNATKCYPPWDDIIHKILDYARSELKLEAGYIELGEDYMDQTIDLTGNKHLIMPIIHIIGAPEWY